MRASCTTTRSRSRTPWVPIAEVQLSHRFGIEGSVLDQRFHYTYWGQLINTFSPGVANVWSKTPGNAWSFPILLNWQPLRRRPLYFGAGPVIRNLRGLDQVVDYESTYSLGGPITTKTADRKERRVGKECRSR